MMLNEQDKQVIEWISQVTQSNLSTHSNNNICDSLKSGVVLCKLINSIKPNTIKKINTNNSFFAQRENLINFGKGCETLGLTEDSSRIQEYIFEDKDGLVLKFLTALMKIASIKPTPPTTTSPTSPNTSNNNSIPPIKPLSPMAKRPLPNPTPIAKPSNSTSSPSSSPPTNPPSSPPNQQTGTIANRKLFNKQISNDVFDVSTTKNRYDNDDLSKSYSAPPPSYPPPVPITVLSGSTGVSRPPPPLPPRNKNIPLSSQIVDTNNNYNNNNDRLNNNNNNNHLNNNNNINGELLDSNNKVDDEYYNDNNNNNNNHNHSSEEDETIVVEIPTTSPRQLQTSLSAPSLTNNKDNSNNNSNNSNNNNEQCNNSQSTTPITNLSSNQPYLVGNPNRLSTTISIPINPNNYRDGYSTISAGSPIYRDGYSTISAGSPPIYVDAYSNMTTNNNNVPGTATFKKPRSSTKQRLEKFFSKSSLTKSNKQATLSPSGSPNLASSSPPSTQSSPNMYSSHSSLSNSTSTNKSSTTKQAPPIKRPTFSSPDLFNQSEDDSDLNTSGALDLSNSGGFGDTNEVDGHGGYNNNDGANVDDGSMVTSEELMKLISQIEFLYKDRKVIKERINFTYPEKYKSFVIYDELLELDRSPTFVTTAFTNLAPRQQYEVCKREERKMLSDIFTLNNVLNIVEENRALAIRVEEYQKMVDSLMVDKKSMTARFDEMLAAKAKSEKHQVEEEGIIFAELNGKMEIIKGGTTERLIERLYNKNIIGSVSDYVDTFLLTYRSFTTSKYVLERLTKTYNDNTSALEEVGDSEKQFQVEQENLGKKKIRLRICNFLKRWVDFFFHDFDTDLLQEYNLFITNCKDGNLNNLLKRTLDKKLTGASGTKTATFGTKPPPPILPKIPITCFDDVDMTELARQLTLIEFDMFKSIASKELLSLSWQKSDKEKRSPNLLKMIHRFNEVSNWVVVTLVKENNLKKRAQHLKRFIKLAEELKRLNNFNCVFVVISALLSASVNRLSKTWNELSKQQQKQFDEYVALTAPGYSFAAYREEIHNANPPCIPYLGVHLSDMTFIEEGNPDKLENGFVNFFKCRMVAEVIKEIQRYQQQPYNLQVVPEVASLLSSHKIITETDCFKLSLIAEPRETSG